MFSDFLIFVAPGLVIIAAIIIAFWVAGKDDAVRDESEEMNKNVH